MGTCDTCRFWLKDVRTGDGACRRNAPQAVTTKQFVEAEFTFANWPRTKPKDWCGDYEGKDIASSVELTPEEKGRRALQGPWDWWADYDGSVRRTYVVRHKCVHVLCVGTVDLANWLTYQLNVCNVPPPESK